MTRNEFLVMDAIDRGYTSPDEISAQTGLTATVVARTLDILASQGRVRRR